MARRGNKKAAELVARLTEMGAGVLVRDLAALGVDQTLATKLMREIAHDLAKEYGGTYIYVPQDMDFILTARDQRIWERFDGSNVNELAAEFGLSAVQIRIILRLMRQQQAAKNQGLLPGFDLPDQV